MARKIENAAVPQAAETNDPFAGQGGQYVVDEAGVKTQVAQTKGGLCRRKGDGTEIDGATFAGDAVVPAAPGSGAPADTAPQTTTKE